MLGPSKNERVHILVSDPRGKTFWEGDKTTDAFGGAEVEFELPASAGLGMYRFSVFNRSKQTNYQTDMRFRVESFASPNSR